MDEKGVFRVLLSQRSCMETKSHVRNSCPVLFSCRMKTTGTFSGFQGLLFQNSKLVQFANTILEYFKIPRFYPSAGLLLKTFRQIIGFL